MNSRIMLLPTIVLAIFFSASAAFADVKLRMRLAFIFFAVVFWLGSYAHYINIKKNNGKLL